MEFSDLLGPSTTLAPQDISIGRSVTGYQNSKGYLQSVVLET